jgi:hypothetical protein
MLEQNGHYDKSTEMGRYENRIQPTEYILRLANRCRRLCLNGMEPKLRKTRPNNLKHAHSVHKYFQR